MQPIKTEADYQAALKEVEALFDAAPDTPERDRLEVLSILVEAYEKKHFPIGLPSPVDAIAYHIESRGMTQQDLEPFIGDSATVADVLAKKAPLTLEMIQKLNKGMGISLEILAQAYELES